MRNEWIEAEIAELLGARNVILDDHRLIIRAGAPRGWLADWAEPGDVLDLPVEMWEGGVSACINGKCVAEAVAELLTELAKKTLEEAKGAVSRQLTDQLPNPMYAANRLALWAGHNWARPLDPKDGPDALGALGEIYAEMVYEPGVPGRAIEAVIKGIYHMTDIEGAAAWGVDQPQHPRVEDNGTIVVEVGARKQIVGRFGPEEWVVIASGPNDRYLVMGYEGDVLEKRNPLPRDYARARTAVEYARGVWAWFVPDKPGEYISRVVAEAAEKYDLEGNDEYAFYASLAHDANLIEKDTNEKGEE